MAKSSSTEVKKMNIMSKLDKAMVKLNKPPTAVKQNFFRLLAVGQRVWLGLRESLISISVSEKNKPMKNIIDDLIEQVNEWYNLADSLKKHEYLFSNTEIELIRASQITWNMPETLESISHELENFALIVKKIKSAMTYPITLLVVTIWAVSVLMVKVIPTIVTLFPTEDALPQITRIVMKVSDFMIDWRYILAAGLVWSVITFIALYRYFLPFKIFIDGFILKIPAIWAAIKTFHMYRFSKLLGDFITSWVDQITAISQIRDIFSNFHYKQKAENIRSDLHAGFTFSDTVEWSSLFDPILIQIISVWEKTWVLWSTLETMSKFYQEKLMDGISAATAFVQPILLMGMAGVIGAIVASIFLPMAGLLDAVWSM